MRNVLLGVIGFCYLFPIHAADSASMYRQARMQADHHVQIEVLSVRPMAQRVGQGDRGCMLTGQVEEVFRSRLLRQGQRIRFVVPCVTRKVPLAQDLSKARYLEAYLNGGQSMQLQAIKGQIRILNHTHRVPQCPEHFRGMSCQSGQLGFR